MKKQVLVWGHCIILLSCIYVIGCCGFHFLPALGTSEQYETINSTLLSMALSYIAGFIIYILTSVIPRKQREYEVFALWNPHLSKLYNEMSERIEEVRTFLDIPKERMKELTIEDCKPFERYTDFPPVIPLQKDIIRDNSEKPNRIGKVFSIKKELKEHHGVMLNIIDTMMSNPMAIDANKRVLDILSQIKTSCFLKECNSLIDSTLLDSNYPKIICSDLPKAYWEYVRLRDQLGLLPITKYIYNMRKRSVEEVKKIQELVEEQLSKQGLSTDQNQLLVQKITDASK